MCGAVMLHLVVLHTNDVHGQVLPVRATWLEREDPPLVGGLKAVAREVQRVRAEVASEEGLGGVLVLDGGGLVPRDARGAARARARVRELARRRRLRRAGAGES